MPSVMRSGDWRRAENALSGGGPKMQRAIKKAVLREAHALRKEIVQGLTKQAPGGEKLKPLSRLTIAARRLQGFGGRKILLRRADLRNAISVVDPGGDDVFVGVPRTATSTNRKRMVDVAKVHEYGTDPFVIPITPKMRRFLGALFAKTSKRFRKKNAPNGSKVVVIQIPARPFMRPAFEVWRRGVQRRIVRQVAVNMGWM